MITREQVNNLRLGDILYHTENRNADHTPQRWRINGALKTWKTRPDEFRLPVKNGLRNCAYITQSEMELVCLIEKDAYNPIVI